MSPTYSEDDQNKPSSRGDWIKSILPSSVAETVNQADKTFNPFRKVADTLEGATTQPSQTKRPDEELEKRRRGGPVKKGKAYLVGEEGPEIFAPKKDGKIIPLNKRPGKKMPAKSKAQQRIMGMARAIQTGEMPASQSPAAAKIAKTMKPGDVEEFASTKHKGLPEKKKPPRRKKAVAQGKLNHTGGKLKLPKAPVQEPTPNPNLGPPLPSVAAPLPQGPPPEPSKRAKPAPIKMPAGAKPPRSQAVPKRTMGGILSDLKRSRRAR